MGSTKHKFGEAIEALKNGEMVAREGWNGKGMFVYKQVPASIPADIIQKMTSTPNSVKSEFASRPNGVMNFTNQLALVQKDGRIDSWSPSSSDCMAEDWVIIGGK